MRYPTDALWQEIAYLAYHLQWPMDDLLDLEHMDRVRMARAVVSMNERAWQAVREYAHQWSSARLRPADRRPLTVLDRRRRARNLPRGCRPAGAGRDDADQGGRVERSRASSA